MSEPNTNSIADFISDLEKLNDKKAIKGKLPFSGVEYTLKPITTKQISSINATAVASDNLNTPILFFDLVKSIFDDLLELEEGKTYKSFNIYDYTYLLFKIRESMDDSYVITNEDGEDIGEIDITERIKEFEKATMIKERTVGNKSCKITLYLPSYHRMDKFNSDYDRKYKELKKQNEPNIESFMNYGFRNMFSLFIKNIDLKINSKENSIDFHALPRVSDQMRVLDHVPNDVIKNIYKEIQEMSKPLDDLVYFDDDNGINLDCGFLITS